MKSELKSWMTWAASSADDLADAGIRRLRRRFGREGVPKIQAYRGYATGDMVRMHGRVLTNPPIDSDCANDQWWKNMIRSAQRFASDEVPGVPIKGWFGGAAGDTVSDAEGYFHLDLPKAPEQAPHSLWMPGHLQITGRSAVDPSERADAGSGTEGDPSSSSCQIMCRPADARYAIISDVDDTVLHTGATDIAMMVKLTFFGNARTRAPLDGVAMLYELMHRGGGLDMDPCNPIFYVSSSPWNLYDLLEEFLELNAIPAGPILLRDLGFDRNKFLKGGHDHKLDKTRRLMSQYPDLSFVLFGDSGQEDARLYATAATDFPDQVRAIFIRDIDPQSESDHDVRVDQYVRQCDGLGIPMYLIKDSTQAAQLAVEHDLLPADAVDRIAQATRRDRKRSRWPLV